MGNSYFLEVTDEKLSTFQNDDVVWDFEVHLLYVSNRKNYPEDSYMCGVVDFFTLDLDELHFSKRTGAFEGAVFHAVEPLMGEEPHFTLHLKNMVTGNLVYKEKDQISITMDEDAYYYPQDNIYTKFSNEFDQEKSTVSVRLTEDFYVILQNEQIVGIVLCNAAYHILPYKKRFMKADLTPNEAYRASFSKYIEFLEHYRDGDGSIWKPVLLDLLEEVKRNKQDGHYQAMVHGLLNVSENRRFELNLEEQDFRE
ncbi:hypothetical protein [Anaerotruncus colihominis]|uniref:hypothetical protein n=1 Tax=Anaerotruncus colihominis TaxID=169435 RepID=UPI0018AC17F7|nr:hypothetical protein [Anaerotruncus colihominis]